MAQKAHLARVAQRNRKEGEKLIWRESLKGVEKGRQTLIWRKSPEGDEK
jgi:hypothetical protein